jgi:Flp pilus assembly protein TadG
MGKKIIAFIAGAAGAFDLSGRVLAQSSGKRAGASLARRLAIEKIRKNIDANSVINRNDRKAICNDWGNVGSCISKATKNEKIICQ